ncbi:MAG: 3-hydroxyacyl-CoA dehydrogenase NAD-binding domain-containing protein [Actinomycetota bacterium]|nr:3-hydroxyacyl-CoA dehydrogenase NAD-binding domain-containing protein [Actinomycetota bacterium]
MSDTEFKLARSGDVAIVTIDNGADHTKPTFFSRGALESLDRLLTELERSDFAALVLTGKPFVFAAGADVTEFPDVSAELAREGSRAGHELFARLSALPYPTVAAINGACLGGGVEIALHCDARSISSAVRHFACPEVFLGIFPAWGGTQIIPRLVGPETAVKFIVANPLRQNRMLDARKAHELGFADALFEPVEFLDDSIRFARELAERGGIERPEPDFSELEPIMRRARSDVEDTVHGAAPGPYRALDLIEGASTWSLEEGYRAEEDAIAELLPSRQAQASIYAFDLVERRIKRGVGVPDAKPRRVERVGIVGAGLMATQLATLFLRRLEVPIVLRDLEQATVDRAIGSIRDELALQVSKGRYDEGKARFLGSLVSGSTSYEVFDGCDLVLEAVFEELGVKQEVFAELERVVLPECVLATNTSSLSVTEMASGLEHPDRVVGMHFFNPVALMPLVELVRAAETDDVTLATAWDVSKKLRKRAVVVRDAPGFVVNRVLTRMTRVLMDALEHGNSVEETDEAIMRLGMPMAPSVLLQMVGPRVANHVLETMHDAFPDRFSLSPTLASFAEGGDEIVVVEDAPKSIEEITEAVLDAVADEIHRLLEEGVVAEAADVDACLILGAGWPFFLGGITKYLDQTGVSERLFGHPLSDAHAVAPA